MSALWNLSGYTSENMLTYTLSYVKYDSHTNNIITTKSFLFVFPYLLFFLWISFGLVKYLSNCLRGFYPALEAVIPNCIDWTLSSNASTSVSF